MLIYLLRRLLYAFPILLGVNIITFALFFLVNTPDDMARMHLGVKHVDKNMVADWKHAHGYDKPLFWNPEQQGVNKLTETLFFSKSLRLFWLDFGRSDSDRDIAADIQMRLWPSLAIAVPTFIIGLLTAIVFGMFLAYFHSTYIDYFGVSVCLILMSVSVLFYIIAGQYFLAKILQLLPISGYQSGWMSVKFVILPIIIGVVGGMGADIRWFRTIFLEEFGKNYVLTARAKGLSELRILFKHILKNALIPIATMVVVIIPSLFLGSLLLESFFAIPGLGSYTIDAIAQQDFAIVRAMVFLGTIAYMIGLILTDIAYVIVDPRVRLASS